VFTYSVYYDVYNINREIYVAASHCFCFPPSPRRLFSRCCCYYFFSLSSFPLYFRLRALYSRTTHGEGHDARESFHFSWKKYESCHRRGTCASSVAFFFFFDSLPLCFHLSFLLQPLLFSFDGRCRSTTAAGTQLDKRVILYI
jgi:hypothetical protein